MKYIFLFFNYVLLILIIPIILYYYKIDILHYHQQGIYRSMEILGLVFNCKFILDKRDISKHIPKPHAYDYIISASENITKMLISKNVKNELIIQIPIIFPKPNKFKSQELEFVKKRLNIPSQYILFIGDIIEYKGIFELIKAYKLLNDHYNIEEKLLIIGKDLTGNKFRKTISNNDNIIYLSDLNHKDALKVIQMSNLVALPSKSEGLPRVCLESIALETKVLCPPNIPEFNRYCPQFVCNDINPKDISEKIIELLNKDNLPNFPFNKHDENSVVKKYLSLYKSCKNS